MNEISPCPRCRSPECGFVFNHPAIGPSLLWIKCDGCGLRSTERQFHHGDHKEAMAGARAWWNERTAHEPPAAPSTVAVYDKCPFTGRPHFMDIEHPELGLVPTYGGPFDSFTIPIPDDDDERTLRSERFDHDLGNWVEGGEPLAMNVVTNEEFVDLHTLREERTAQPPASEPMPLCSRTALREFMAKYWPDLELRDRPAPPPGDLRSELKAYLQAIGAPMDGLAKQSITAFLMWMEDRATSTKESGL